MSTLPTIPSYNPNIPIISSAGGTAAAYEDPNSPESTMKKVTELQVQSKVDTKYNVNVSPYYEGFSIQFNYLPLFLLVHAVIIYNIKGLRKIRYFLIGFAIILALTSILHQQNGYTTYRAT